MSLAHNKLAVFVAAVMALPVMAPSAFAVDWTETGSAIRVKTVAIVNVDLYQISHYMKQLPSQRSKQAVIDLDGDKKFIWTLKHDIARDDIQKALRDGFAMNGYGDAANIDRFVGAFKGALKDNGTVTIAYDSTKKATSVNTGSGSATVSGVPFMKAVWSIWFGKIDQPKLGDQLISKLP